MKTPRVTSLAIVFLTASLPAQDGPAAAEMLARLERILRPEKSFVVTAHTTTFKNRTVAGTMQLRAFVRVRQDGSLDSLAFVTAPEAERGKVYLRKAGGELWFYDPKSQRPVRISARQRFQGQASLDDLLSINLKADYSARLELQEVVTDATGEKRSTQRVQMVAKAASAPYSAMTFWVDRDNLRPVKATCFAAGGRALKTVFYDKFRGFLGEARPTEINIVDEIHPNLVSQVRFSEFDHRELAGETFQEAFMPVASAQLKP